MHILLYIQFLKQKMLKWSILSSSWAQCQQHGDLWTANTLLKIDLYSTFLIQIECILFVDSQLISTLGRPLEYMLLKIRVTKCKIHLVIFLFRNIKLYKLDVVCCVRGITFNISFILKDLCLKILESKQIIALIVEQMYIAKSNRLHNPSFVWTDFDLKL